MRVSLLFHRGHALLPGALVLLLVYAAPAQSQPSQTQSTQDGSAELRPLSAAQIALFDTPHLANVSQPETLRYAYRRVGPAAFTDIIAIQIKKINRDGTKELAFDYLSGPHHVLFPELDHFRGNPLLMLALERDVAVMNEALGISKAFLRNRIRQAFLDSATVSNTSITFEDKVTPARTVTVTPFAQEQRLERIPSLQAKTYTFVLADAVPGGIDEIRIETPEDPALHAPALSEQISFAGVAP
jgi:hypothetical protein